MSPGVRAESTSSRAQEQDLPSKRSAAFFYFSIFSTTEVRVIGRYRILITKPPTEDDGDHRGLLDELLAVLVQLLLSAVALSPPLKDRHPHHPVLPMGSFAVPCVSFLSSLSRRALSPCADANCLLFLTCRLYRCVASTSLDAQSSFVTDAAAI